MVEFDVNDMSPDARAREHSALAWLRRHDPVYWDAKNELWILTRYADVREVSKRPELFSSALKGPWHLFDVVFSMQAQDGPEHLRTRGIVSRAFTPRRVGELEERARRYVDEAIDAVAAQGRCELVRDLAVPVPMRIIADMVGLGEEDVGLFRRFSDLLSTGVALGAETTEEYAKTALAFAETVQRVAEERRRAPREDCLSVLLHARDEGRLAAGGERSFRGFSKDDLVAFVQFLIIAGNETTRNAISRGMWALIQHPEQRRRLAADPRLLPTAVEEILRWTSPVRVLRRTLARDTELRGKRMRAGESVLLFYPSANRDEEVFESADRFRVDRDPNEHLAFGIGSHFCLGANLARMEIRVVVGRLLERLPDLALEPGARVVEGANPIVAAMERMPVVFTPGRQ